MKIYSTENYTSTNQLNFLLKGIQLLEAEEQQWKEQFDRHRNLEADLERCQERLAESKKVLEDLKYQDVLLLNRYDEDKKTAANACDLGIKTVREEFEKEDARLQAANAQAMSKHDFDGALNFLTQIKNLHTQKGEKETQLKSVNERKLNQLSQEFEKKRADLNKRVDDKKALHTKENEEWDRLTGQLENVARILNQQALKLSETYTQLGESVWKLKFEMDIKNKDRLYRQTNQSLPALTSEEKAVLRSQLIQGSMGVGDVVAKLSQSLKEDEIAQQQWALQVFKQFRGKAKAAHHLKELFLSEQIENLKVRQQETQKKYEADCSQVAINHESHLKKMDQGFEAIAKEITAQVQKANQQRNYSQLIQLGQRGMNEEKKYRENRKHIIKEHESKIAVMKSDYKKRNETHDLDSEKLKSAKNSKKRHHEEIVKQIQYHHRTIQDQKIKLLDAARKIQGELKSLKYALQSGELKAIQRGLSHNTFKVSAERKVEFKSRWVAEKVTSEEVATLLKAVTEGQLVTVKNCLTKNPQLVYARGDVTDSAARFFPQVTVLQYAFWACDFQMCDTIFEHLSLKDRIRQIEALLVHRQDITDANGNQFSFSQLIQCYDAYHKNSTYTLWSRVGEAQMTLPDWVIYMMTERGQQTAWTLKEVNRPISRNLGNIPAQYRNSIKLEQKKGKVKSASAWIRADASDVTFYTFTSDGNAVSPRTTQHDVEVFRQCSELAIDYGLSLSKREKAYDVTDIELDQVMDLIAQGELEKVRVGLDDNKRRNQGHCAILYVSKKKNIERMEEIFSPPLTVYQLALELNIEIADLMLEYFLSKRHAAIQITQLRENNELIRVYCDIENTTRSPQKLLAHCDKVYGGVRTPEFRQFIENEDSGECSPLNLASRTGHLETVRELLNYAAQAYGSVKTKEFQAFIEHENGGGFSSLNSASHAGNSEVVRELLECAINVYGSVQTTQFQGFIAHQDKGGFTPLNAASNEGRSEVVKLLLEYANRAYVENIAGYQQFINHQDKKGFTPLISASYAGHEPVVSQLLTAGHSFYQSFKSVDMRRFIEKCNKDEFSALHSASSQGHEAVVKALLEVAVKVYEGENQRRLDFVNQTNRRRSNCLNSACFNKRSERVAILLLNHGALPTQKNCYGQTALDNAPLDWVEFREKARAQSQKQSSRNNPRFFSPSQFTQGKNNFRNNESSSAKFG